MALSNREEAGSRLDAARKSQSDEDLAGTLAVAQQEFDNSLKSIEEVEAQLQAADPDSLEVRLENTREAKRRAVKDLQSNRDGQNELRVSLEIRGEMGLQGSYDEAVSRWEQFKREHERSEVRARATRLLFETFERHRSRAHQRYVEPFKKRIDVFWAHCIWPNVFG